jgi:hypothetical protein
MTGTPPRLARSPNNPLRTPSKSFRFFRAPLEFHLGSAGGPPAAVRDEHFPAGKTERIAVQKNCGQQFFHAPALYFATRSTPCRTVFPVVLLSQNRFSDGFNPVARAEDKLIPCLRGRGRAMKKYRKFRLYPAAERTALTQRTFGRRRFVFNRSLAERIKSYRETGKSPPLFEQTRMDMPEARRRTPNQESPGFNRGEPPARDRTRQFPISSKNGRRPGPPRHWLLTMERQLKAYREFLRAELEALAQLAPAERAPRALLLAGQYRQKMADFQHERLIHLIITLFFAFLLMAFFILALFSGAVLPETLYGSTPAALLFFALIIIFILEIFYIKHYFFLENNVQSLYLLGNRLYECLYGLKSAKRP